jgi:hypothetical protein
MIVVAMPGLTTAGRSKKAIAAPGPRHRHDRNLDFSLSYSPGAMR